MNCFALKYIFWCIKYKRIKTSLVSFETRLANYSLTVINYLPLTTSLNFLPAENTGTVLAGILMSLPV